VQPVRVLGKCGGTLADIADAIVWASGGSVSGIPANPTVSRVINMSLGGGGACGSTYQAAIDSAVGRGTVVIVAAGNSNANVSNSRPANCNNVVAIAAIDRQGNRASYSNFGTLVDVGAPGGETATQADGVLSTLNTGTQTQGSATYAFYQGTSMATPHVAGLAALMLGLNSSLTPAQVETFLKDNTRPLAGSCTGGCGTGLVNAVATLQAVGGGGNVAPVANYTFTTSGLTASFTDASSDSDGTIASRSWNFGDSTTSTATNPGKTYAAAGTYSVTLTVTDDDGATDTETKSVTVTNPGGNVLQNGVPVTSLSGAAGSQVFYTASIPSGATNLVFTISGGTGDADMYVRFGSPPTTSTYNCRPYLNGNNETCTFATPSVGTYHVMLRGYTAYSGVTLRATWTVGGGGPSYFENLTDFALPDNTTIESPITVSGRTGNAPAALQVAVRIIHTYKGDLIVSLIAPDNTAYVLHNRAGGSTNNIIQTFTVNASSEVANGVWKLRVQDAASQDTGTLEQWSLQF
jgi:serine protease